jgi:transposase-like protein
MHVLFHHHEDTHYHCSVQIPVLASENHQNAGERQNIEKEIFKCPVCGYEFTPFSLSNDIYVILPVEKIKNHNEYYKQKEIITWCGTNKNLRAPPV